MSSKKNEKNETMMKLLMDMQAKIDDQTQRLAELQNENKQIKTNTEKMAQHIDFINDSYEKVRKSFLFKNIF
jgi:hypothetical protein